MLTAPQLDSPSHALACMILCTNYRYYFNGQTASVRDFLSLNVMDTLLDEIAMSKYALHMPVISVVMRLLYIFCKQSNLPLGITLHHCGLQRLQALPKVVSREYRAHLLQDFCELICMQCVYAWQSCRHLARCERVNEYTRHNGEHRKLHGKALWLDKTSYAIIDVISHGMHLRERSTIL